MKTVTIEQYASGCYNIGGDLTFASINADTPIALAATDNIIKLNFSQVEASDSAGLALIIEWLKSAKARQFTLQLENLPDPILSLAKLSGMETILGLSP